MIHYNLAQSGKPRAVSRLHFFVFFFIDFRATAIAATHNQA